MRQLLLLLVLALGLQGCISMAPTVDTNPIRAIMVREDGSAVVWREDGEQSEIPKGTTRFFPTEKHK